MLCARFVLSESPSCVLGKELGSHIWPVKELGRM